MRHLRAGDMSAAEPLLERLVAERPSEGRLHYLLGFCRLGLYEFSEAEAALRTAVALEPREHAWQQALAKALLEQGRYREALAALERAVALQPRPEYLFAKAVSAINAGETATAESALRACLSSEPGHAEAAYELARIEADRGDDAAAVVLFRRALAASPENVEARFRLGLSATRQGESDEARDSFEAVLVRVPSHVGALYNLARLDQAEGDVDAAQAKLARFAAASLLEDEIRFLEEHVRLAPKDLGKRLELAAGLLEAGHAARALTQLQSGQRLAPRHAETYRKMGEALRRLGRNEDAKRADAHAAGLEAPRR